MTSETVTNIEQAVEQAAPTAPVVEVAEAAVNTATNPSVSNIIADIELVFDLAKQLKTLAASNPTLNSIVEALF